MKIHQGTLRELVKEQLLEILEEDDTLLEMFMESARVGIIKSVSADIRHMIQRQAQQMQGRPQRPPMQEDDGDGGDGGYDGGYGGYGDYGMGGGGQGGYTGNYHIPQARRKGMARFYEENQHGTMMGEGFDPEMAPNVFRNELAQAKQAASRGRQKANVNEMGDHQIDELMGESAQPPRQQRQAPQNAPQGPDSSLFVPADRQAYMEAMAMEAAVGDSYGPMPTAMQPDTMYMNEEYSRAIPQGAIPRELIQESLKSRPKAYTPEDRLHQAQMAPQHSGGYRNGDPTLDKTAKELGLRQSGGETPQPLERFIPQSQLRDGDGKPMVSVNDPRLDGKRHASSKR